MSWLLDALAHAHQHGEGVGRRVGVVAFDLEELARPVLTMAFGIGIVALDVAREVGRLLGEIAERQPARIVLDRRQLGAARRNARAGWC